MSVPGSDSHFLLSGGCYGVYRGTLASSSGGAADPSNLADAGADTDLAIARTWTAGPRTVEDAGIRAGEIVAYRAWLLRPSGFLGGVFMEDYEWRPGQIEKADDLRWAGLHAFKTLDHAINQYGFYSYSYTVVFGRVHLWGEVIEHESGYRAEYAAIDGLICANVGVFPGTPFNRFRAWRRIRELRRVYGLKH